MGKKCKFDLIDNADRREANASETSLICVNNRRQHIIQYVLYDAFHISSVFKEWCPKPFGNILSIIMIDAILARIESQAKYEMND